MDEIVPNWAKQLIADVSELKNQTDINCNKLDALQTQVNNIPLKIKQDLFPQLITEIRNCVREEITKKF